MLGALEAMLLGRLQGCGVPSFGRLPASSPRRLALGDPSRRCHVPLCRRCHVCALGVLAARARGFAVEGVGREETLESDRVTAGPCAVPLANIIMWAPTAIGMPAEIEWAGGGGRAKV
jgi:hypothetical protein